MEDTQDEYPPIDSDSIAPCKRGIPDLYNNLPSRLITQEEAKARGWKYFYEGEACLHEHIAPRFVSNRRMCVDCHRAKKNLPLIGAETPPPVADVFEEEKGASLPLISEPFEWTDEKRARLIEIWVDTGAIAEARTQIGVTPSEYLRELDRNPSFAEAVKDAEPKADKMLEERAYALALQGNDRLLVRILSAKFPAYRESLKLDVNNLNPYARMSDEEISARLAVHMARLGLRSAIDGEAVEPAKLPAPITN